MTCQKNAGALLQTRTGRSGKMLLRSHYDENGYEYGYRLLENLDALGLQFRGTYIDLVQQPP
jgi:hypothetical protein